MSGYSDGRRAEYKVIAELRLNGYETIRAAASKGKADVVAVKPGELLFVSVKRSRMPSPAERADLIELAGHVRAVPLVALARLRRPIAYWELVNVGSSAGSYRAFTLDRLEDQ